MLARRAVEAISITYVGKESNLLEDVENEIVHDLDEVQQQYEDTRLDLLKDVLKESSGEGTRKGGADWRVRDSGYQERSFAAILEDAEFVVASGEATSEITICWSPLAPLSAFGRH